MRRFLANVLTLFILHTVSSPHNKQIYNMLWIINIQYVFTPPHDKVVEAM